VARVKLDTGTLSLSPVFEKMTGARVKDCFLDEYSDVLYFIVAPGDMGKAIGKSGVHIHTAENLFRKKIRIVEYNDDVATFIRNMIFPLKVETIGEQDNFVILDDTMKKTKSLLIGRDGRNIALLNRAVGRFFSKEIRIA